MKKLLLFAVVAFVSLAFVVPTANAQTMEEQLMKMVGTTAEAYVAPIVSGFGSDLNGGWFRRAPKDKVFGIDIEFGLVAMGTTFKDENKVIPPTSATFQFTYDQAKEIAATNSTLASNPVLLDQAAQNIASQTLTVSISGPNIMGKKSDTLMVSVSDLVVNVGGTNYNIPGKSINSGISGYLDGLTMLPLAAPQLSIGTVWGTMASFRYLPEVELDPEIGKFKYFGFGIQHNPKIWPFMPFLGMLPVDLSLSFFTQKLSVGTLFEAKGTAFGLNVSKQLGFGFLNLTPYAGFMLESSSMKFTYDAEIDADGLSSTPPTVIPISFELEGENSSRITLGASIRLLVLNLNVDYNIAKYNSITGGVMFIF